MLIYNKALYINQNKDNRSKIVNKMTNIILDHYSVLPLRDLVMFPKMIVPLFVGRDRSIKALEKVGTEDKILLVAQKDASKDNPKFNDIYKVGVLSRILQVLKLQDSTIKVLVEGVERVKIIKFYNDDDYIQAQIKLMPDNIVVEENNNELVALRRSVIELFEEYIKINKRINPEILNNVLQIQEINSFCNAICAHIILAVDKKQKLLEMLNVATRLEHILVYIDSEIELLKAENRIKVRVRNQIEQNQKDYYLNEQLKAIHKELGEDTAKDDLNNIAKKIKQLKMPKEVKSKAESELKKLKSMNQMSSEASVVRSFLDWIIELPWKSFSPIKKDLKIAEEVLDKDHYGLEKVKERITEYLAVGLRTNNLKSPILCLVGPPGVGKTSLARSIATATGRNFVKIALGGLRDEAEIKGHRRTYIGAMPGKIIQAMKKAGTNNPVILLDEIDKMGHDFRGDPTSALLEVLDPEQNKTFNDHYLEVDYDLSNVMFIATANTMNLPRPLLDRLEIIRLSGYTEEEKLAIAKEHLISKQSKAHALKDGEITIEEVAIKNTIRHYTMEAGVRNLDRSIAKIMRKSVKSILMEANQPLPIIINDQNLDKFLGIPKFNYGEIEKENLVGIINGLAYTEVGGDLLAIEAAVLHNGKGDIKLTGKLGDVMKESIQAAIGYIRSRAADFGIEPNTFKENDIHIHVPEGATPKDGPSAGIGMFIAIVSALTGIPIKNDIAVTGEITLTGRVLAIGGLKEKLMAAMRGNVNTVLIPQKNIKDLEEIPEKVKNALKIIPVNFADEALKIALLSIPLPKPKQPQLQNAILPELESMIPAH